MSLYDKMKCAGPSGCGHPRHRHSGTHAAGSKSACTQPIGNGRSKCACQRFKEIRTGSSDSKPTVTAESE